MVAFSFSKQAKIVKTDDFSSVFNFRKRISTAHLMLHYQPNTLQHGRLGVVVAKKVAKSAVCRNYMRRVLREQFRLLQHEIAQVDCVIRVQKKFNQKQFHEVKQEFNHLMLKVNQRVHHG